MRIKIQYDVITKPDSYEKIPNNIIHAFILGRLPAEFSKEQHKKGVRTLFTFGSNRVQFDKNRGSFIFAAPDNIAQELVVSLRLNEMFRLGKYYCQLNDIREINDFDTSLGNILLRGRILLSSGNRQETIREKYLVEKYLSNISEDKLNLLGIEERLKFDVVRIQDTSLFYAKQGNKATYLPAADIVTSVTGSPESLNMFLDFGAGQNTGAGAGMMWEV